MSFFTLIPDAGGKSLATLSVVVSTLEYAKSTTDIPTLQEACSTTCNLVNLLKTDDIMLASKETIQFSCAAAVALANECINLCGVALSPTQLDYIGEFCRNIKAIESHYQKDLSNMGLLAAAEELDLLHEKLETHLKEYKKASPAYFHQVTELWNEDESQKLCEVLHARMQRPPQVESNDKLNPDARSVTINSNNHNNSNNNNTITTNNGPSVSCDTFAGVNGTQNNNNTPIDVDRLAAILANCTQNNNNIPIDVDRLAAILANCTQNNNNIPIDVNQLTASILASIARSSPGKQLDASSMYGMDGYADHQLNFPNE